MNGRREQIALRKEALRARAALERIELAEFRSELRRVTRLGDVVQQVARAVVSARGLPLALDGVRRFPMIGAIAQFFAKRVKGEALRTGLRVAAIAWLGWQGVMLVRAIRRDSVHKRADDSAATVDLAGESEVSLHSQAGAGTAANDSV